MQNLTTIFRRWRRTQRKGRILKVFQGDDNLIAELSKPKKYAITIYKHIGSGAFITIKKTTFKEVERAKRYFKKVMDEF